ncbi:MAG: glycosyl hydrolase 115 family protein [Chthoniobacteraceae bacterium]
MSRKKSVLVTILLGTFGLASSGLGAVDLVGPGAATAPAFVLVGGSAAPIILPPHAPPVVKIAAQDLAGDIATVSGQTPKVLEARPANLSGPRVELQFAPALAGKWEAFQLAATAGVLTISASDARGLAYGIYELSRRIGVSPWHWWADVPAPHHAQLLLSLGNEPVDQPAVKYRGIFINDEDWGLEPWAAKTFEPEVGNLGPKTYARIFELMLRLRANLLWPAMHPRTTPFFLVPGNADTADRYDIIVGSSHAEPMLRVNGREWKLPKDHFNYLTHRDEVLAYWEERVRQRTGGESLFTIGMRGIEDSPMIGPKTQAERISTLQTVFADQRELLAKYLGNGDPTRIGQIFVPYKEVLDVYNGGLKVPDDVTLVWPDDNYGYIRRYATPEERARSGGLGVYYHNSYSGLPFSWIWVDTLPPVLPWSEMMRAYEQGARKLWIVNVGDIKNTERSMEFFLNLAWHADRTDLNAPARFIHDTAARDFGPEHAAAIASVLTRLQTINFARKTEHLQWFLTGQPYQPTELNEAEISQRLQACAELQRDSDAVASQLPAEARDAYFELVGYPVAMTTGANERYFRGELARADVARGRSPAADQAAAAAGQQRINDGTARYNNAIAGGKWRNIVSENGVSPKDRPRFQRDTKTVSPAPTTENVCPPAPAAASVVSIPAGAQHGDFVERDQVVSMDAGHFTHRKDLASGAGWRALPGLGRSGSAVTVLPSTVALSPAAAPSLDYRFYVSAAAPAKLHVRLLPTHPLVTGQGLRFAVGIDDGTTLPLAITTGFDPTKSRQGMTEWQRRVLANATETVADLPQPLAPGWHTLHLVAVDAGVVVDKIVIDLGGLKPSYDGPAETCLP